MQPPIPSSSFTRDHFSLLGLPRDFDVDDALLETSWKKVALAVHPDRFATHSAAEKRVAMQWSSQANEAYRVLKDPMSRARYICELAGIDLQTESNTAMSSDFLLRQMSWHEQLEEILEYDLIHENRRALYFSLQDQLAKAQQEIVDAVKGYFAHERFDLAALQVREWMFINKLIAQLRAIE